MPVLKLPKAFNWILWSKDFFSSFIYKQGKPYLCWTPPPSPNTSFKKVIKYKNEMEVMVTAPGAG